MTVAAIFVWAGLVVVVAGVGLAFGAGAAGVALIVVGALAAVVGVLGLRPPPKESRR